MTAALALLCLALLLWAVTAEHRAQRAERSLRALDRLLRGTLTRARRRGASDA